MARHDRIAYGEFGYIRPNSDHVAGGLTTRDEGWFRTKLIFSSKHQHIDVLDASSLDSNLDFAGTGGGRVRDFAFR
jgi:hypothetical protein